MARPMPLLAPVTSTRVVSDMVSGCTPARSRASGIPRPPAARNAWLGATAAASRSVSARMKASGS